MYQKGGNVPEHGSHRSSAVPHDPEGRDPGPGSRRTRGDPGAGAGRPRARHHGRHHLGGTLLVNAGNAADRITISKTGSTLVVTNPADSLSADGSCTKPNPTTVNCPAAGVTIIRVSSQGGDDIVTNAADMNLRGFMGAGNDEYNGDDGDDILRGSSGDDDILSGDGGFDRGSGGPGIRDVCQTEFRSSTCEL